MRQSLDASYDVHIVSFLHKIQCTISLNEGGIFITRKYQNPSDKIYIHKTCLIGCTKGVNSRWSEKCNACLRLTYFKLRKNFRKGNSLVALQKTNLNILFQSEKEACRCLKAMELHFQNTESAEVKPYLVIINPQSGTGNAMSIFSSKVAPIWKQMNIPYELLCTEHAGHAEDFVLKLPKEKISGYRALVPCSGDGLVNEVAHALAMRSYHNGDKEDRIPVGILPAGTGNATAASICYHAGLTDNSSLLLNSAFLLTLPTETTSKERCEKITASSEKRRSTSPTFHCISPLTGIHFATSNRNFHRFGVLCIEWGIFSDLDYKSERLRWMGDFRFTIYGYYCIMKKPSYRAKLSYLPIDASLCHGTKCIGEELVDKDSDLRSPSLHENSSYSRGTFNRSTQKIEKSRISWSYLPDSDQPILNNEGKWITLEDEFISILVTNHSHMAANAVVDPNAHFSDSYLNLILLHKNATRLDLLRIAQNMSNGKGLKPTPHMDIVRICALRVEPSPKSSVLTMLDGEIMPPGTFQAEVMPGYFNVISGSQTIKITN